MTDQEYEKKIFDLNQLLEISKSLNSTLEINNLLDSLLYTIMGQLKVVNIAIFLRSFFDDSIFRLQRNYKGFEFPPGYSPEIDSDSLVISELLESPRCYTLGELVEEFPDDPGVQTLQEILPSLIIPMIVKGGLVGFILVGEGMTGEMFNSEEKRYVLDIALFGGIAIHNSFLFEMASTDMMTKLKLRHYLLTMLEKTYNDSIRTSKKFAIIMIDIDHFKKLNDTYGHSCGDMVLIQVADIIRKSVRKVDYTARYGGEEFIILLPDVTIDIARVVGQRIRAQVEEASVLFEDQDVSCTVSLGIALYNRMRDHTPEAVIKRADLALYRSKETGRNRLTVSREGED